MLNPHSSAPAPTAKVNLLIIGQQKAGTTWLFHKLVKHPQISGAKGKELFFFNRPRGEIAEGLSKYYSHFNSELAKYHLEASAIYFWHPETNERAVKQTPRFLGHVDTPSNVYETLGPETKIIVLLRHPVARAISSFYHHFRQGRVSPSAHLSSWGKTNGVVSIGKIQRNAKPWRDLFSERNILPLLFDDLKRRPDKVFDQLSAFLELDDLSEFVAKKETRGARKNQGFKLIARRGGLEPSPSSLEGFSAKKPPLWKPNLIQRVLPFTIPPAPRIRRREILRLQQFYQEDIRYAEQWLQRDLPEWREVSPESLLLL